MTRANTLIVGIGSPHGDDAVGWEVAELLASNVDQRSVRVEKAASPIHTLEWMEDIDQLIVCDACRGLGVPGNVRRWVWPASELVPVAWSGTHDFSLLASLQLAERLGRLPRLVVIWTVEASAGSSFEAMSPEIAATVPRLVRCIASEVSQFTSLNDST